MPKVYSCRSTCELCDCVRNILVQIFCCFSILFVPVFVSFEIIPAIFFLRNATDCAANLFQSIEAATGPEARARKGSISDVCGTCTHSFVNQNRTADIEFSRLTRWTKNYFFGEIIKKATCA